jgi:hypothetical protein
MLSPKVPVARPVLAVELSLASISSKTSLQSSSTRAGESQLNSPADSEKGSRSTSFKDSADNGSEDDLSSETKEAEAAETDALATSTDRCATLEEEDTHNLELESRKSDAAETEAPESCATLAEEIRSLQLALDAAWSSPCVSSPRPPNGLLRRILNGLRRIQRFG